MRHVSLNASISPSTIRFPHFFPRRLRLILSLPRRLCVCGLDRRRSESFSVKVDEAASLFLFLDDSAFLDSLRRRLRLVLVKPRPIGFSFSLPRRLRLSRLCPLTTPPRCGETSTTRFSLSLPRWFPASLVIFPRWWRVRLCLVIFPRRWRLCLYLLIFPRRWRLRLGPLLRWISQTVRTCTSLSLLFDLVCCVLVINFNLSMYVFLKMEGSTDMKVSWRRWRQL